MAHKLAVEGGGPDEQTGTSEQLSRDNVKEVQEALKNKGHDPGRFFDLSCRRSIRSFCNVEQRD
ncbi:MAG TPA: hypothetical protein VFM35_01425, partial [Candidatus Binatia bacterium]|nr:hypothetical protein [Candidatus Binatia bacterium]